MADAAAELAQAKAAASALHAANVELFKRLELCAKEIMGHAYYLTLDHPSSKDGITPPPKFLLQPLSDGRARLKRMEVRLVFEHLSEADSYPFDDKLDMPAVFDDLQKTNDTLLQFCEKHSYLKDERKAAANASLFVRNLQKLNNYLREIDSRPRLPDEPSRAPQFTRIVERMNEVVRKIYQVVPAKRHTIHWDRDYPADRFNTEHVPAAAVALLKVDYGSSVTRLAGEGYAPCMGQLRFNQWRARWRLKATKLTGWLQCGLIPEKEEELSADTTSFPGLVAWASTELGTTGGAVGGPAPFAEGQVITLEADFDKGEMTLTLGEKVHGTAPLVVGSTYRLLVNLAGPGTVLEHCSTACFAY